MKPKIEEIVKEVIDEENKDNDLICGLLRLAIQKTALKIEREMSATAMLDWDKYWASWGIRW